MFKSLSLYRISSPADSITSEALEPERFAPCSLQSQESFGFVPPRNLDNAPLIEHIAGEVILRVRFERRRVPQQVIKTKAKEMALQIEQSTGRKPGRKQMKELEEQALMEELPKAFSSFTEVPVWVSPKLGLLAIGATGSATDPVATALAKSIEGLSIRPLQTLTSPATGMTTWLLEAEPPADFSIDRDCTLSSADEMKSVVRYARHALDIQEVQEHIRQGKVPQELALTWKGRVSFHLNDRGALKRLEFQDVVFEGQQPAKSKDESFDTDVALSTGELKGLISSLVEALGGEMPGPGEQQGSAPAPQQ